MSEIKPCKRSAYLGSFPEVTAHDAVAMGLGQLRLSWWEDAVERPCAPYGKQGSKDKKDQVPGSNTPFTNPPSMVYYFLHLGSSS